MGEAKGRSIECGAGAISLCEAVVMALHRVERAVGALHPIEKTAKYYYAVFGITRDPSGNSHF